MSVDWKSVVGKEIKFKNIPDLFRWRVEQTPERDAFLFKRGEVWTRMRWDEVWRKAKALASALIESGFEKGDKACIWSYTRPEWIICDLAIQLAGGISVPIYQTLPIDQAGYIINDSEATFVFAEDEDKVQKLKDAREQIPRVKKVISFPKIDEDDFVVSLERFEGEGEEKISKNEGRIDDVIKNTDLDDIATLVYTSGTTGVPKGVIQTHLNHLSMVEMLASIGDLKEDDNLFLFLPLAHSFARAIEMIHPRIGFLLSFAESIEKVVDNLAEVKPTVFPSVPRIFEKVHSAVLGQAKGIKKKIIDWALNVGREAGKYRYEKKTLPPLLALKYKIAHALVFSKLHKKLGGRIRFFVSGGAPLSKEIAEFFWAAGLLILEGYGLTETTPALTINTTREFKFGTVGKPLKWVEIKIAEDGEIVARGPNIAKGYWKKPKETEEVFKPDGWFHTGDIGEFDEDGFLRITDRKKDLIKTAGGKYVAPQPIENMIKASSPLISQVVVIGDAKPYCVALVTLDREATEKWAREQGIDLPWEELVKHELVQKHVQEVIDKVNSRLARFETIKKFAILPEDFSIEAGDLTPTLKVRRKIVMQKYKDIIDSLYEGK